MTIQLPTGVQLTALAMAQDRRVESSRPDRLFNDPFAGLFVDAAAPSTAESAVSWLNEGGTLADFCPPMGDFVALRTRYFDDRVRDAVQAGVRDVVVLAAGLDTRAFRLSWPEGTRVFEVDLPDLTEFKTEVLAAASVRPACRRTAVAADLRGDWPAALRAAGFDDGRPTAWLVEGLLMYLSEDDNTRLLTQITESSTPDSRLVADHAYPAAEYAEYFRAGRDALTENRSAFGSTVADPDAWLVDRGWAPGVARATDLSAEYRRPLPPVLDPSAPDAPIFWLTASTRNRIHP